MSGTVFELFPIWEQIANSILSFRHQTTLTHRLNSANGLLAITSSSAIFPLSKLIPKLRWSLTLSGETRMNILLGLMLWLGGFSAGGVGGYYLECLVNDFRSAEPGRAL